MSSIAISTTELAAGVTGDIYAQVKKIAGDQVPETYAASGQFASALLAAVLNAEGALASHIQMSPSVSLM